jgi:hypothetical protein
LHRIVTERVGGGHCFCWWLYHRGMSSAADTT